MCVGEPWWWSALTPADTAPLLSLRQVALLLDGRSGLGQDPALDVPVYSALRVAEIITHLASAPRVAEIVAQLASGQRKLAQEAT